MRPLSLLSAALLLGLALAGCGNAADSPPDAPNASDRFFFPVQQDGRWGYIDRSGELVIDPQFEAAYPFSDGRALVQRAGRYGYIDRSGELVIPARFEDGWYFSDGEAPVKDGAAWQMIDTSGTVLTTLADSTTPPTEVLARLSLDPRFMVEQKYPASSLERFTEDDSLYGYRTTSGEVAIPPQFDEAWQFSEGRARVQEGGQWGFIDEQGAFVIAPQFEQAWDFRNGLALVASRGQYSYIDTTGAYVWQPSE